MAEENSENLTYQKLLQENRELRQKNAQLSEENEQLRKENTFDKLTKFYKEDAARNKTMEILRNNYIGSDNPSPVSLILMDLDRFRDFNKDSDEIGNQAVVRFGEFIREDIIPFLKERNYPAQGLEEPFLAFRSFEKGDTFGLVLSGVGLAEARKIADDLQKTEVTLLFEHQGEEKEKRISFSAGVASTEEKEVEQFGESGETIDARAKALYDELKRKAGEREKRNKAERARRNG